MTRLFLFFLIIGFFTTGKSYAQLTSGEKKQLETEQDSLKAFAVKMINAPMADTRIEACNQFIPRFVNALKTKNSFAFSFDSLKQISTVYDEDSTFRIFTWGIALSPIRYRFYGALQRNTKDGQLKLFPLFDNSFDTENEDTITSPKAWLGALYYNMVRTTYKKDTLYTLMGWCGYRFRTNKKVLEVLTFKNGQPVFGAPVFNFEKDSVSKGIKNRFFLKYKRNGAAGLNYDSSRKMIIYDHLSSLNHHPEDAASMVPDGTYSGFKWENGYWMHIDKVFHNTSKAPPIPEPLKFNKPIQGNKNNKAKKHR